MPISLSGSLVITGSITTTGVITMSGSIASASYSSNSDLLRGTGSVGFTTTASFLAVSSSQQQVSASYIALSGSYNTFSGSTSTRITRVENNYATTGSNSFRADQSITGSLVVSSAITAQTLVVQTITSSVSFITGSTRFGSLTSNTHQFTGSMYITGALYLSGSVGIGTNSPVSSLHINEISSSITLSKTVSALSSSVGAIEWRNNYASTGVVWAKIDAVTLGTGANPWDYSNITFSTWNGFNSLTERMRISNTGNVGIGTVSPSYKLQVQSTAGTIARITDGTNNLDFYCGSGLNEIAATTSLLLTTNGATRLTIASTGAATFSSSVGVGNVTPYSILSLPSGTGWNGGLSWNYTLANSGSKRWWINTDQIVYGDFRICTEITQGAGVISNVATLYERFYINASGNVGIAETSPASKLSIGGVQGSTIGSNVALLVGNNGAAGTVGNMIQIGLHYNPAGATPASVIGAVFTSTAGYTKSDIFFATRDVTTDTVPTERMRITSGGNVGIQTTAPASKLHVAGAGNAAGGNIIIGQINDSTAKWSYLVSTQYNSSTQPQGFTLIGGYSAATENTVVIGGSIYEANPATSIQFWTHTAVSHSLGGSQRMTITSAGNVGIGTTSPTSKFFLLGAGSYNTPTSEILTSDATIFSSEMSNDAYNSILQLVSVRQSLSTGASSNGFLGFSTIDDSNNEGIRDAGRIAIVNENGTSRNSATALSFWTNSGGTKTTAAAEKLRLTSGGYLRLASSGIQFNGDTAAANALNDYEEGTWTPVLRGSTVAGTVTYTYRSASYVKIGNYVFVRWGFKVASISSATGTVQITGLPFTSVSWGSYQEPSTTVSTGLLATAANAYRARVFVTNSSTVLEGRIMDNGDTPWDISDFGGDEWIIGELFYNIA